MAKHNILTGVLIGSLAAVPLAGLSGCEAIQENKSTSGALIGGAAGAGLGAAIFGHNRIVGGLVGGAVGAGGGWLIGTELRKSDSSHRNEAMEANRRAEQNPVTPEQARNARTADINGDGYVTMDEVVAMSKAGLSDDEMIQRLKDTGQLFELTPQQERYLEDHGVDRRVVVAMRDINSDVRDRAYSENNIPRDEPDAYRYEPGGERP